MDLRKLSEQFPEDALEWRPANVWKTGGEINGKCFCYVTARHIMQRFDEVCGPANWKPAYIPIQNGFLCGLAVKIGDEWVEKFDGSDTTDIEPVKGAISGALKRAAVLWGCGRYLYDLPEGWIEVVQKGTRGAYYYAPPKDKGIEPFYWLPPKLPAWALPGGRAEANPEQRQGDSERPKFPLPQAKPGSPTKEYSEFAGAVQGRLQGDGQKLWGKSSEGAWTAVKLWVIGEKVGDFASWAEVEACADKQRLIGVHRAFVDEGQRRQDGEMPF